MNDSNQTPFELWYGYKPNVCYFKVFGSKCYILKESRKGKFDVKSDEGIFLGYSNKRKAYKFLNLSTHKVIESTHVKIDEFVEEYEEQRRKEPENYKNFVYYKIDTLLEDQENGSQHSSPPESPKPPVQPELQPVQPES